MNVPVEFSWENVTVYWLGSVPIGILEISLEEDTPAETKHGLGKKAISIGNAQQKFKGSMKLFGSQYSVIKGSLPPKKSLTQIAPSDMVVVLGPNDEGLIEEQKISGIKVTNISGGWKVGDTMREVTMQFICTDVTGTAII